MRGAVLAVLLVACSGRSVVGTATVSVYSNGGPGSEVPVPPLPVEGASVFEDGGAVVMTGSDGNAVVQLHDEQAIIHVVQGASVTTIVGVPPGGVVRLGGAGYSPTVGVVGVTLQDVGATSYSLSGPESCTSISPIGTTTFDIYFRGFCGGKTVHLFGEAVTSSGTKIAEQDVALVPSGGGPMGAYADAMPYTITLAHAPTLPEAPQIGIGIVDPGTQLITLLPSLDGPVSVDLVHVVSDASSLYVRGAVAAGASTIDASHMLPVPVVAHADPRHVEWSLPASDAQPNLVSVDMRYQGAPGLGWTVYGPPTLTSATFPELPAGVTIAAPDASAQYAGEIDYYEEPRQVLTPDELHTMWSGLSGFAAATVAVSRATF